jgi:hypothetical protein
MLGCVAAVLGFPRTLLRSGYVVHWWRRRQVACPVSITQAGLVSICDVLYLAEVVASCWVTQRLCGSCPGIPKDPFEECCIQAGLSYSVVIVVYFCWLWPLSEA